MKKVMISLLCLSISAIAAHAQQHAVETNPPSAAKHADAGKFSFKEQTHDYGTVAEGPIAECDFEFTNVGAAPISITEAHGSCGCTVPQWPHTPIMPGQTGTIHVKYTTTGHPGLIRKDVIVNSNAEQASTVLHITGSVKPATAPTPTIAN